jgi:hypothetical protein
MTGLLKTPESPEVADEGHEDIPVGKADTCDHDMRALCNMLEEVCKHEGQPEEPCVEVRGHGDAKALLLDIGQCATLEVCARERAAAGLRNGVGRW